MSEYKAYMSHLSANLKGFNQNEQEDILAEIESHIVASLTDEGKGDNQETRTKSLLTELGSPIDMARNLQHVHWRHRWSDLLLIIIIPFLIYKFGHIPQILMLDMLISPETILSYTTQLIWISTAIQWTILIIMPIISWRRGATAVTLWWLSLALGHFAAPLITLLQNLYALSINPMAELPHLLPLILPCILLTIPFGILLYQHQQHKFDGLLLAFVSLPLLTSIFSAQLLVLEAQRVSLGNYNFFASILTIPVSMVAPLSQALFLIIAVLCFFSRQTHWVRWSGIVISLSLYLLTLSYTVLSLWGLPISEAWQQFMIPITMSWSICLILISIAFLKDTHYRHRTHQ